SELGAVEVAGEPPKRELSRSWSWSSPRARSGAPAASRAEQAGWRRCSSGKALRSGVRWPHRPPPAPSAGGIAWRRPRRPASRAPEARAVSALDLFRSACSASRAYRERARAEGLEELQLRESSRFGGSPATSTAPSSERGGARDAPPWTPTDAGLVVVSCERG